MRKSKCIFTSLFEKDKKPTIAVIVFGGVLSALAFSLIPNSVSAMTYSSTIPSFSSGTLFLGCNSVNSDEGYLAIGPRGSLFGVDEGSTGCGYYWRDGELKYYRDNENSVGSITYNPSTGDVASYNTPSGYVPSSYQYNDYVKYGFRAVLNRWNNSFNNGEGDYLIPAITDSKFGKYFVYGLINYSSSYSSFLVPSLSLNQGEEPYRADNGFNVDTDEFINDVYSTTIFVNANDMKQYLPADIYNALVAEYNIQNDDWGNYFFLGAFLPQYNYGYYIRSLNFSVDTNLVQDSLEGQLSFHVYEVGIGNNSNLPKLNYLSFVNPVYNGSNELSSWNLTDFGSDTRFRILGCTDSECLSAMSGLVNTYREYHNNTVGSFKNNNKSNVGFDWFNVFTINFLFPFQPLFDGFTNSNQCVNIPIIGGMLHNPNVQYCSWWDSSIRDILTPVFTISAMMILTGFIYSWLSSDSSNLGRNISSGGKS